MYEYLIGVIITGIVWAFFFKKRKDLRKPMIWTALVFYLFSGTIVLIWYILEQFVYLGERIVPSYWNPHTLFNLSIKTGFGGIEDTLFIFFISGISTCIYEYIFNKRIILRRSERPHLFALVASILSFYLFDFATDYNIIYSFIFSAFIGALFICLERRDLVQHVFMGGLAFLFAYLGAFSLFTILFPEFISQFYNLSNLSGIVLFGIPIEEYFYAFSFGMLWAPIYEYIKGEKDADLKK